MNFGSFETEWLGRRVDYDHVYNYQCVDLILEGLHEMFGISSGVSGNAIDYWTNPSSPLLSKFDKIAGSDALQSDIVVLNGLAGNPDGHIGWATGNVNATEVEILEQNGQNGDGDGGNPNLAAGAEPLNDGNQIRTRFIARNRVAGLLRPKANVVISAAPAPAAAPSSGNVGKILYLPPSVSAWHVYKPAGPWTLAYATHILDPAAANGLSYPIIGSPASNIYLIQTEDFGEVAIYAGPDTVAQFKDPTPPPAPTPPAPAATPAPTDTPAVEPGTETINEQITITTSMLMVREAPATSAPANEANTPDGNLHNGNIITVTGWVHAENVSGNDVWLRTVRNNWIWSGGTSFDLSQTQTPEVSVAADPAPAAPIVKPQMVNNVAAAAAANTGEAVDVKVTPFQDSFKPSTGTFRAKNTMQVTDLSGVGDPITLNAGNLVYAAGTFSKGGVKYVRTVNSVKNGVWYGVPVTDLVAAQNPVAIDGIGDIKPAAEQAVAKLDEDADDIPDELLKSIGYGDKARETVVADVAKAEGFVGKIFNRNKKG